MAKLFNGGTPIYVLNYYQGTPMKSISIEIEDIFDTFEKMYSKGELLFNKNNAFTADRKCTLKNLCIDEQGYIYLDTANVRLYGHEYPEWHIIANCPLNYDILADLCLEVKKLLRDFYSWLDAKGKEYEHYIEH